MPAPAGARAEPVPPDYLTEDGFMAGKRIQIQTLDRLVRIAIGLFVLSLAFVGPRTPLGWMGLFPLMTGLLGGCPGSACSVGGSCAPRPPEGDGDA